MKKAEIEMYSRKSPIAVYYGELIGIGAKILDIEYGYNDYIVYAWIQGKKETYHRKKLYFNDKHYYFIHNGKRISLSDCIRVDTH